MVYVVRVSNLDAQVDEAQELRALALLARVDQLSHLMGQLEGRALKADVPACDIEQSRVARF
eukprot:7791996-Pyramimonas_sp.AAC.2